MRFSGQEAQGRVGVPQTLKPGIPLRLSVSGPPKELKTRGVDTPTFTAAKHGGTWQFSDGLTIWAAKSSLHPPVRGGVGAELQSDVPQRRTPEARARPRGPGL